MFYTYAYTFIFDTIIAIVCFYASIKVWKDTKKDMKLYGIPNKKVENITRYIFYYLFKGLAILLFLATSLITYESTMDVFTQDTKIIQGEVLSTDRSGGKSNYEYIRFEEESLRNKSSFDFQVGKIYKVEYMKRTKYIIKIEEITND